MGDELDDDDTGSFTWDASRGGLAAFMGLSVQMHIPGQPLSIILEETMSEAASIVDSITYRQDGGEWSDAPATRTTELLSGEQIRVDASVSAHDLGAVWDARIRESTRCVVFFGLVERCI